MVKSIFPKGCNQNLSSEGVHILPVKPYLGPHQYLCSPQDSNPVKIGGPDGLVLVPGVLIRHDSNSRQRWATALPSRLALLLLLLFSTASVFAQQSTTIDSIRVIGNRRIPKETILARMFTHPGDTYDPVSIERDFNSLWNTGYFEDLRIEREDTEKGIILDIFVRERPNIREINYKGLNSITQSDVLDRFKKEKVGLSVDGQYDATKIKAAETVIKQMEAEHGHQFATIKTEVKTIPPASVQVN